MAGIAKGVSLIAVPRSRLGIAVTLQTQHHIKRLRGIDTGASFGIACLSTVGVKSLGD